MEHIVDKNIDDATLCMFVSRLSRRPTYRHVGCKGNPTRNRGNLKQKLARRETKYETKLVHLKRKGSMIHMSLPQSQPMVCGY